MRQGPNNRRPRGRNGGNRRPNLPNRNQTYESSGPDVRIRGNAYQVHEKYLALARDASASGDRVMAENYLQHAEHYYRIILAVNEAHAQAQQQPHQQQPYNNNSQSFPVQQGSDGARDNGARGGTLRQDAGGRSEGRDRAEAASRNGAAEPDKQQNGFAARDTDPRDQGEPLVEFGEDPRQADPRDAGEDQIEGGNGKDAGPLEAEAPPAESGNGHASEPAAAAEEEPSRPPRRRRAAGRQRRTGTNGSAETAENPSSDPVDQADLGV